MFHALFVCCLSLSGPNQTSPQHGECPERGCWRGSWLRRRRRWREGRADHRRRREGVADGEWSPQRQTIPERWVISSKYDSNWCAMEISVSFIISLLIWQISVALWRTKDKWSVEGLNPKKHWTGIIRLDFKRSSIEFPGRIQCNSFVKGSCCRWKENTVAPECELAWNGALA